MSTREERLERINKMNRTQLEEEVERLWEKLESEEEEPHIFPSEKKPNEDSNAKH